MSVQSDTLVPLPQHTPPLSGQSFKFDPTWMRWFLDLQFKANVITGNPLPVAAGGTGLSSYTIGGILVASAATTISTINPGTAGDVLTSNGVGLLPSYQPSSSSGGLSIGIAYQLPYLSPQL